jgi:WD40 repeat protein
MNKCKAVLHGTDAFQERGHKKNELSVVTPLFFHKQVIPKNYTLFKGYIMSTRSRINLVITGFLLVMSIVGIANAASVGQAWKELPPGDGTFSGLMFSSDGSMVFAGGSQTLVRSWDGEIDWGGRSGTVATMNADGTCIVTAIDSSVRVLDKNGVEIWTRIMGSDRIRAVAVSKNCSLVIGANDQGYIQSWDKNGVRWGLNKTDLAKAIAISPSGSLIVVTSDAGLKFFTPALKQTWADNKSGALDKFIAISADGATVITAGDTRVWSHTPDGDTNWVKEATRDAIIDMACSDDCTTIVLGSQDGEVLVLNQLGQVRWKYPAGSWINGVGVSADGSVIAAGAIDGSLYILDKYGNLLAQTKTDTVIQQRSVEISRDGKHVIVADDGALFGFNLFGLPEVTPALPRTPTQEASATCPVCPVCPSPVTTSSPAKTTAVPRTTGTPEASLNPYLVFIASAGIALIVLKRRA